MSCKLLHILRRVLHGVSHVHLILSDHEIGVKMAVTDGSYGQTILEITKYFPYWLDRSLK